MKMASRYHPLLVTLHWLLALLILAALAVGFFLLASMDNSEPRKIVVLHGGDLRMNGTPGKGAVMTMQFAESA